MTRRTVHPADGAIQYARDVTAGTTVAGRLTRLACERFLGDLESTGRWRFDRKLAEHAVRFVELMPVIDGGPDRNIVLQPWQLFVVCNLFGWVDRTSGERRFMYGTLLVGRGNGKSFLASAIADYVTFGTGQTGAEGYCLASAMQQSRIVWKTARDMIDLRPRLKERLGIETGQNAVTDGRGNVLKPLSSEHKTQYGLRPAIAVVDELHVVDEELYSAIATALGKRKNPLLLIISTAGFQRSGLAWEHMDLCRRILEGRAKEDRHFVAIWQADDEKDLLDRNEWLRANPGLNVTVSEEVIEAEARAAIELPSKRSEFITLRLNRFASPPSGWIDMARWDACADPSLRLEQFEGRDCYIGVDLALRRDLCSKVYVFPEQGPDGLTYTVFQRSYLPEAQGALRPEFRGWAHEGRLELTPGDITDLARVERDLLEDARRFDVRELCFDIAHAGLMVQNLGDAGHLVVNVPQRTSGLSQPMKDAEEAILKGRLRHDGDPLFRWTVSNVVQFVSAQGNVFPEKCGEGERIDPAVALITAFSRAPTWQGSQGPLLVKWM